MMINPESLSPIEQEAYNELLGTYAAKDIEPQMIEEMVALIREG